MLLGLCNVLPIQPDGLSQLHSITLSKSKRNKHVDGFSLALEIAFSYIRYVHPSMNHFSMQYSPIGYHTT